MRKKERNSFLSFLTGCGRRQDKYFLSKQTRLIGCFVSFVFLTILILDFIPKSSVLNNLAPFFKNTFVSSVGLPVRLKITKINVNAAVEFVGLTADGIMGAPKSPTNVAWFNLGPRPGEKGSAVISGHYGWKDGISAVFDNLKKLKPGDKLLIKDEKGVNLTFVVREVRVFGEKEDASTIFYSNDEKAHLNLITCGGIWDKAKKSYSERTVVFTDKE